MKDTLKEETKEAIFKYAKNNPDKVKLLKITYVPYDNDTAYGFYENIEIEFSDKI